MSHRALKLVKSFFSCKGRQEKAKERKSTKITQTLYFTYL